MSQEFTLSYKHEMFKKFEQLLIKIITDVRLIKPHKGLIFLKKLILTHQYNI